MLIFLFFLSKKFKMNMKTKILLFMMICLGMHVSCTSQNSKNHLAKVSIETDFNLIFLPLNINGSTIYMIVDTGAGFSVIDEEVAKNLDLTIENVRIMERPGGDVHLGSISSFSFNLEDHEVKMPIASANLAEGGFNDYIGRSCAGILGYDFISRYGLCSLWALRGLL